MVLKLNKANIRGREEFAEAEQRVESHALDVEFQDIERGIVLHRAPARRATADFHVYQCAGHNVAGMHRGGEKTVLGAKVGERNFAVARAESM